jgi:O-antigen biosynthesis protein
MVTPNNPLVSVIIPTYNRYQFLKRAILSVVNQTYRQIEILIIDDGSTDDTREAVDSIKDARIKYFCHKKNMGPVVGRNEGVNNSLGEFITFLDDDDEWMPEKISKQLEAFKGFSTLPGLVFTNGYSEYKNDYFVERGKLSGIIYDPKADNFFPLAALIPPPSSWMIPRPVMEEVGFFDEKMRNHWDDGDYLVRLARKHPVYFLNESLVIWHALSSHLETVSPSLIKDKEVFFEKNYALMKKDKEYFFRFCRSLGKDALHVDKCVARKYLFKALRARPLDFSVISKLFRSLASSN